MGIIYRQASVIPFRLIKGEFELLLITALNSGQWIFPKGIIDDDLSAREAAAQEAYEEAGVKGTVPDLLLGTYTYKKWGGICNVQVYPLQVLDILEKWPEEKERKRCWVSVKKARKIIKKKELRIQLGNFEKNDQAIRRTIE
jgi:8-oxo-dGTP pyrophosphatase MutT (NUDIX family)